MLQQLRFELQIGWIAIDSHLKTVGRQLLLEDACKVRCVCVFSLTLDLAKGFHSVLLLTTCGMCVCINFGFGQRLPLCASVDYLWDVTAMWDKKVMLDVKTYAS